MRRAIFLDIETTGLDASKAQALEIAFKVVNTESGKCLGSFQSVVSLSKKEWRDADPIALKINGFTWDDVKTRGRPRNDIAVDICSLFSQLNLSPQTAFFLCQNPSFDRAFFSQLCSSPVQKSFGFPYYWLDFASMNWALTAKDVILGKRPPFCVPFSKDGIAQHEGLPLEEKPHKAMNGVDHLLLLFSKIVGFPRAECSAPLRGCTLSSPPGRVKVRRSTAIKPSLTPLAVTQSLEGKQRRSERNRTSTRFFEP